MERDIHLLLKGNLGGLNREFVSTKVMFGILDKSFS